MKKVLILSIISICFFSCQKEILEHGHQDNYLENVKSQLIKETKGADYSALDFSKAILTSINYDSVVLLRIPFFGREVGKRFILLHTDLGGSIKKGKIININKSTGSDNLASIFNGEISFQYLNGVLEKESKITNGYIESFHKEKNLVQSRGESVSIDSRPPSEPDYKELPEIVVTGYYSAGGQLKFYDLVNLQTLIYSQYPSNYYSFLDGLSYGDPNTSSGAVSNNNNTLYAENGVAVDFDLSNKRIINLEDYLKCFQTVPDEGSICSIELFADIPVDEEARASFNWQTGSPGHTFLQLRKEKGGQIVTQNIGFYPSVPWKTLISTVPMQGVFVDDANHEFNASIKRNITPSELNAIIGEILRLSKSRKYDIGNYNCTDLSLDIFNFGNRNELVIDKYDIPGVATPYGSSTPQGLYLKLQDMKPANLEGISITIPGTKGWVGRSRGACN